MNKINPGYTNKIYKIRNTGRLTHEKYKLNLEIPKPNHAIFGTRSLTSYSLKIWNVLTYHIEGQKNLISFKAIIRFWDGKHCTCRVCEITDSQITDSHKNKNN